MDTRTVSRTYSRWGSIPMPKVYALGGLLPRQMKVRCSRSRENSVLQAMGLTPLFAACQSGHLDVVKLLLSHGADVNHVHVKTGRTALMEASCRTNVSIVKELLRYGLSSRWCSLIAIV